MTDAQIKRRGLDAIEEVLRNGPVRILKRNRLAAVVLSEDEYQRLVGGAAPPRSGTTALQWLLAQSGTGTRDKKEIDAGLAEERDW